ncbi:MAG TPA: ABC transporter substrate-binding protein [Candidatus Krumholzibacteria bacterium]|nr:ABC transporter substrate-binding protein [Candidatus Krumholzibacteria bacterium]HPD71742.1 ABC transporter substrate-binding protein [Candidatus Krumholzibacteria bacterium]HRY41325.1 ABC transporter substrate-binding protein [Candidatus Krumholzibacteria bacterium]
MRSIAPGDRSGWLVAVVLGMVAGCQGDAPQPAPPADATAAPSRGGTVVVALPDEPDVLNSLIRTSAVAGSVLSLLQAGLAEMGEDLQWYPMIAERWEVAPDSLAITYHLRPWTWEDGTPLTADDVRASYELLTDPRIASPRADQLRPVVRVTTPDLATVRYEFAAPQAQAVQTTVHSLLPAHRVRSLDPSAVATWPLNRSPLASGPFRLESWEPGRQLVLAPNPHYPLAAPWLDRVILRIVPDETARVMALETGEIDLVFDVPATAAARLATDPQLRVVEVPGRVFAFLMWNVRRPVLRDPAVRRALSLALDRERFVAALTGGFGAPAASYLPPALWNHHRGLVPDPCRPDSAAALLAAAGWVDHDGDGVRERSGVPLRLEVIFRGGDTARENGVALVRRYLTAVGVDVSLRALELATALEFLRAGRFDAYFGEYQANLYADPSPLVRSGASDRFNFGGYANARVDSLLDRALAEPDRTRSLPIWYAVQEALVADPPAAVLYYPRQLVAYNRRVRDVRPHLLSPLNNLAEWWIAPADRRWADSSSR